MTLSPFTLTLALVIIVFCVSAYHQYSKPKWNGTIYLQKNMSPDLYVTRKAIGGGGSVGSVLWKAPNGKWYPASESPYSVGTDGLTNKERDPNYMKRYEGEGGGESGAY